MIKKTILSVFLLGTLFAYTQVGIGTTSPTAGSILDIASPNKGLLIPRVALNATNLPAPITPAPVEGMMVYNTVTAGPLPNSVTPGFYFWDGTLWVRVAEGGAVTKDWTVTGNGDIDATDFIGTTNAEALRIRTSNIDAFEISGGDATARGKLRSFTSGTAALPVYSWNADPNTGMFTPAADNLAFSTNGAERMRVDANGNVGINSAPAERLHIDGNLQLDGAFMPGGISGNTDQILISKGAGNNPEWGPGFLNVGAISNIGKFFTGLFNINNGVYLTLIVPDANMTIDTVVSFNLVGGFPPGPGPQWGNNFRMAVEPRNGEVRFYITNTSGFNLSNIEITYTAFYN